MAEAIDTPHTFTMSDGTVVTTTWHDTHDDGDERIAATIVAAAPGEITFRRVIDERPRGAILGAFRAVTWSKS